MVMLNIRQFCDIIRIVAPSSSGPGRLVLIQKIAGSTPAGVTNGSSEPFFVVVVLRIDSRRSHQNNKNALWGFFVILKVSTETEPAKRVRTEMNASERRFTLPQESPI